MEKLSYELQIFSRLMSFEIELSPYKSILLTPIKLDSRVPIGRIKIGGNSTRQSRVNLVWRVLVQCKHVFSKPGDVSTPFVSAKRRLLSVLDITDADGEIVRRITFYNWKRLSFTPRKRVMGWNAHCLRRYNELCSIGEPDPPQSYQWYAVMSSGVPCFGTKSRHLRIMIINLRFTQFKLDTLEAFKLTPCLLFPTIERGDL